MKTTKQQQILIVALYKTGAPVDTVAQQTGVSENTIYSVLKSAGVPLRERQGMSPAERRLILDMSRDGLNLEEISKRMRLKKPVVRDVLRDSALSLS